MSDIATEAVHGFHIPVMGTGFTIDTPLKVAKFGITSVVSIVDDRLIEKLREYYYPLYDEVYEPIASSQPDARARRITDYLNFMQRCVNKQMDAMKKNAFEDGSDACRYFEMISDEMPIKKKYIQMRMASDPRERENLRRYLLDHMVPGHIDVNIMTKADKENKREGESFPRNFSDACSALRGFAQSDLCSSVVFSAGLNLFLYGYVSEFKDFHVDPNGFSKKKIILKVSDFRSAMVQAKIFAKKGLWVSEYRVESGLNCGGHAFATQGYLLGPILEEFRQKQAEMLRELFSVFKSACASLGRACPEQMPSVRLTAQGGIGTSAEHRFLKKRYALDSIGWGSPFLLVPEATSVDPVTLEKLVNATSEDIVLSQSSPLGVPFYTLRTSASEEKRLERIREGKPGSPCISKYLTFNKEFGEPLCTASFRYQSQKIAELDHQGLSEDQRAEALETITAKACICRDLGDGALMKYGIKDENKVQSPAICPGPNVVFFSRTLTLKEMVDHIYGRLNVIHPEIERPHVFINELKLYVDYTAKFLKNAEERKEFVAQLMSGIQYYRRLAEEKTQERESLGSSFLRHLDELSGQLITLSPA